MPAKKWTEERVLEVLKKRPEHITTKGSLARWIGVHENTLYVWRRRWPAVKAQMDQIKTPLVQKALKEAYAEGVERGDFPCQKTEHTPTAAGLAKLQELAGTTPALRHIAARLGYSQDTLERQIAEYDEAKRALELGRAQTLELVTHATLRQALEGNVKAAEMIFKLFAPDLLQPRTEHHHKHEFTFNVPDVPTNPALDARIIDADADDHA